MHVTLWHKIISQALLQSLSGKPSVALLPWACGELELIVQFPTPAHKLEELGPCIDMN